MAKNYSKNFEKLLNSYGSNDGGNGGAGGYEFMKLEIGNKYVIRILNFTKSELPFNLSALHSGLKVVHPEKRSIKCSNITTATLITGEEKDECPVCTFVKSERFSALMSSSSKDVKKELYKLKASPVIQLLALDTKDPSNAPRKTSFFGEQAVRAFLNFWESLDEDVKKNISEYVIGVAVNKEWKERYVFKLGPNKPLTESEKTSFKKEFENKSLIEIVGMKDAEPKETIELIKKYVKSINKLSSIISGEASADFDDDDDDKIVETSSKKKDAVEDDFFKEDSKKKEEDDDDDFVSLKEEKKSSNTPKEEAPKKIKKSNKEDEIDISEFLNDD